MNNILMNVEMTKAILDGRKVQTRRVIKTNKNFIIDSIETTMRADNSVFDIRLDDYDNDETIYIRPMYEVNDIIWVREPARVSMLNVEDSRELTFEYLADDRLCITNERYQVNLHKIETPIRFTKGFGHDCDEVIAKWIIKKQCIPNGCIKEMARIFLRVTNVRVEILQDISVDDMCKEGVPLNRKRETCFIRQKKDWIELWNKTSSSDYKWEDNPYVFVYEFERVGDIK